MSVSRETLTVGAILFLLVLAMNLFKVGVWQECRVEHSFLYCLYLIGF